MTHHPQTFLFLVIENSTLPAPQLSSLIGREKELTDIKRLLQKTSLVTRHGPGGADKTRLMLQVTEDYRSLS